MSIFQFRLKLKDPRYWPFCMKKILFRLNANQKIGYGHFMRCISIAEELKKKYSYDIYFLINKTFSQNSILNKNKIKKNFN